MLGLKCLIFVCLSVGSILAQDGDLTLPANATSYLPPELQGKVDETQVKEMQNKTVEALKKKCEQNGGPTAYQNMEVSIKNSGACINELVDTEVLQKEVDAAKTNGTVDEVFKKYCDKTPSFKKCLTNVTEAAKACLSDSEKKNMDVMTNITTKLGEFVCFKDGDRIALFIAEGGPECFQQKQEAITECLNSTFGEQAPKVGDVQNMNFEEFTIPTIAFDEKSCNQLTQLQTCVVNSLVTCEQPTSANIVESLFNFVRKATPCKNFGDNNGPNSRSNPDDSAKKGANGLALTSALLTFSLAMSQLI